VDQCILFRYNYRSSIVWTDASGNYEVHKIHTVTYKVMFSTYRYARKYFKEWYNDKSSFDTADSVSVTAGSITSGIDAQLTTKPFISLNRTYLIFGADTSNTTTQSQDLLISNSGEAASILRGIRYTFRGLSSDAYGCGMLKEVHLKYDLNLVLTIRSLPFYHPLKRELP